MNLGKEVRKSILPFPTHLMKNEQLTWPPFTWLHLILVWRCVCGVCVFVCACLYVCMCLCNRVPLKADGVSKGVVWRSSVCSVDN